MTGARPPIPAQRDAIAAEAKRCANQRVMRQHILVDELQRIDALSRRLDDLLEALGKAAA